MKINIIKTEESIWKKQLKLVSKLEEFLSDVSSYKSVKKLHDLFYWPHETKGPYVNKYSGQLLKTNFYYFIHKDSFNTYWFLFAENKNRQTQLKFPIDSKSIPSILKGLTDIKVRLHEGDQNDDQPFIYAYLFDQLIEKHFQDKEFTKAKFINLKKALLHKLQETIEEVDSLTY